MTAEWTNAILAAAWLLSLLITFRWILRDPLSRRERVVWILLVGLFPFLGALAYLAAVHWGSPAKSDLSGRAGHS